MVARVSRISFGPGKQAEAQALARELTPRVAAAPGCQGVWMYGDKQGEYGLFSLWDTEAHSEASYKKLFDQLAPKYITPNVKGNPETRLFEIISK